MISKTITCNDPRGLHYRPAKALADLLADYDCTVRFKRGERIIDVRNVSMVLSLFMRCDDTIELETHGPDEKAASDAVQEFFETGYKKVTDSGE